eukprot:6653332-Karenia_brevis.AAC.1
MGTSNWINITKRIEFHDFKGNSFGPPAPPCIEILPAFKSKCPHDKCIDHNLTTGSKEYYMLMARVAPIGHASPAFFAAISEAAKARFNDINSHHVTLSHASPA